MWGTDKLVCFLVAGCILGVSCLDDARAANIVLHDDFNTFDSLGVNTTWQAHAPGAPNGLSAPVVTPLGNVLRMTTNNAGNPAGERRGIESIDAISLAGVSSITVTARLQPINQGIAGTNASAEVAILGSSGQFAAASAGTVIEVVLGTMNWADFYSDSTPLSSQSSAFLHCDNGGCDSGRTFEITIDQTGTTLAAFNLDGSAVGSNGIQPQFGINSSLTLADLGSEFRVALRQLTPSDSGDGAVIGDFDFITVATTSVPEPQGIVLLTIAAVAVLSGPYRQHYRGKPSFPKV